MNLWSDSKGFHRKTQKMIPAVILSWVSFHVFSFSAVVSSSRSLHIKNSTSHNAELKKKKTIHSRKFSRKRRPIRVRLFLCRVCFYQYCRFVHQKFWSVCRLFDEVTCFHFLDFFCCYDGFMEEGGASSCSSGLWDDLGVGPVYMDTNKTSVQKKTQKEAKNKKQTKRGCYLFKFCLYWNEKKKYWHWTKWTKNKKSIFYSVYMEIRFQYVALLCCTNQMCLWHFSNLIYFIVFFVFLLHH